jgi:bisphosphoglycerate-dependent phosphoglycerate mutase
MKYIDTISDEDIEKLEMPFGEIIVYEVDADGHAITKESTHIDSPAPNA